MHSTGLTASSERWGLYVFEVDVSSMVEVSWYGCVKMSNAIARCYGKRQGTLGGDEAR